MTKQAHARQSVALLSLLGLLLGPLPGCYSTSYQTRNKRVTISSDPPGALIVKQDASGSQLLGNAPLTLEQPYKVKVKTFRHWAWLFPALTTACAGGSGYALSQGGDPDPGLITLAFLCTTGAIATLVVNIVGEARSGRTTPVKSEKVLLRASLPGRAPVERSLLVPHGASQLALQLPLPGQRQAQARPAAPPPTPQPRPKPADPPPSSPRSDRPLIVAVFDVQDAANRFNPEDLAQVTEYLSAKLTEVARFRVVPRQQLRERLVESKKEGYQGCFEESCQIELGKAVAAQKSLATKLLKIGNTCAISTTLYDLRSETTEAAASARTGCTEEALIDGMDKIVQQLARRSYR